MNNSVQQVNVDNYKFRVKQVLAVLGSFFSTPIGEDDKLHDEIKKIEAEENSGYIKGLEDSIKLSVVETPKIKSGKITIKKINNISEKYVNTEKTLDEEEKSL